MSIRWDDDEDDRHSPGRIRPRRPACDLHRGKKLYNSEHAADRALQAVRDYGAPRDKKPTRAYRCPGCGKWALTSQPR